jgi:hypothetical protein
LDKQCIEMPKNFRGPINHVALLALLAHGHHSLSTL